MKIAFNGIGCGWGNNGGTQSVFRMADALNELGVETEMWAHCPSRFTWFEPKTTVRVCSLKDAPAVDVLINSGCSTTKATYEYPRKKIGIQWLRGHETWARSEEQLFALYGLDMPIWANSEWLADMVTNATDVSTTDVQYCGIPIRSFGKSVMLSDDCPYTVGALWSSKPLKNADLVMELFQDSRMDGIRLMMFGNESVPTVGTAPFEYIQQPTMKQKCYMMSQCGVWLATSRMEGLHIPPMEAALCGATTVAPTTPSAGVSDYCIDGLSGLTYKTIDEAIERILTLRDDEMVRRGMNVSMRKLINEKIGDVPTNAKRMVEKLGGLL